MVWVGRIILAESEGKWPVLVKTLMIFFWFHDKRVAFRLAVELLASHGGLQFIVAELVK